MPVLERPTHVTVGASDVARTSAFFAAFGFRTVSSGQVPPIASRALYGLPVPLEVATLAAEGNRSGRVTVVETTAARDELSALDSGPRLPRLYTRSLDESIAIASDLGFHRDPVIARTSGATGDRQEMQIIGPDFLRLGLVEDTSERRVFDGDGDGPLHSGVIGASWVVDSLDGVARFWESEVGLARLEALSTDARSLADALIPRSLPIRIARVSDSSWAPLSLELIRFESLLPRARPTWPLRPGLHALAFSVRSVAAAMAYLRSAMWGPIVEINTTSLPGVRAVAGLTPGGVRLELWQRETPCA